MPIQHLKLPVVFPDHEDVHCIFTGKSLLHESAEVFCFSMDSGGEFPYHATLDIGDTGCLIDNPDDPCHNSIQEEWDKYKNTKIASSLTAEMILEFLGRSALRNALMHDDLLMLEYDVSRQHVFSLINLRYNETTS